MPKRGNDEDKAIKSLAAFRASRTEMPAHEFGKLVADEQWEGEDTKFLVYASNYWIEKLDDGRHMVVIENGGGITGEDVTLEDLEEQLYDWVKLSHEPLEEGPASP